MVDSTLTRIDADIAKEKQTIAAAEARLAKLQAAREVLAQYEGSNIEDAEDDKRVSLGSRIESVLVESGPTEPSEILRQLNEAGVGTTYNSVSTTLGRLKTKEFIWNEGGKWDLTTRRRKTLTRNGG
jgi:hypothetical protein